MYFYIYLLVFLVLLYSTLYYIFIDEISIYQVKIEHFNFDLLYKKQPIVITDSIINIDDIIFKLFNYNIIYYDQKISNIWERNKYKYCIIYASDKNNSPIEISLCNPLTANNNGIPNENSKITTIKLQSNKVLIIPFKWYYHISGFPEVHGIHDYITYGISCVSYK
jgi:hypothetical protein